MNKSIAKAIKSGSSAYAEASNLNNDLTISVLEHREKS